VAVERHLSDSARAGIAELLEPGESLADASTWADEHRRELPKTAPWHYADVPLDAPRYDDRFALARPGAGPKTDAIATPGRGLDLRLAPGVGIDGLATGGPVAGEGDEPAAGRDTQALE
jgi:hypothetical protein